MERLPILLALTPDAERAVEHLVFGREAVLEARSSAAEADELEREVALCEATTMLVSPDPDGLAPWAEELHLRAEDRDAVLRAARKAPQLVRALETQLPDSALRDRRLALS